MHNEYVCVLYAYALCFVPHKHHHIPRLCNNIKTSINLFNRLLNDNCVLVLHSKWREKIRTYIGWTVSKVDSDVAMYIVLGSFKLTDT